jgi:glyoxylase-like metal-dependent hydrolase (beta-lactamase superfamily II)
MQINSIVNRVGNDIVAAYLVADDRGITVIDAGLAGQWNDLRHELTAMGRRLEDIRAVILTHGDGDHVGFAERLRREYDVPVYVGAADASRAKGGPKPKNAKQQMRPLPMLGFLAYTLRKNGARTTWLQQVEELHGGETLDLPGDPQIIALPGHSEGSMAVWVPAADAVFVGDGLTTRHVLTGVVGPAPAPFTDEPAEAVRSLRALVPTGARWVLPGHGAPFDAGIEAAVVAVEAAAARGA